MAAPSADIPCCSPATTESVAVVRDKVADSRADILIGQGNILKSQGDYTSAILRDANGNALMTNANIDRSIMASMSQTDKYGLANLNATSGVSDNVTRSGFAGVNATHDTGDRLGSQANTIAWNQSALQNSGFDKLGLQANTTAWNQTGLTTAGFAESRSQLERVNDAQGAMADRTSKYLAGSINDSFGRLSAQGETGFYRTGQAVGDVDKQVVQSEIGLTRTANVGFAEAIKASTDSFARLSSQAANGFSRQLQASTDNGKQTVQSEIGVTRGLTAGFADSAAAATANYARLSEQNFSTKETIAGYGNRASDQTASVLATLSAQHNLMSRDIRDVNRDLGLQSANQFGSLQLEASKNTNAVQMQAAVNSKEGQMQAALNAKESLLEKSKWFALAEKTAMVNKCDLADKLAECCCEIKEAVIVTSKDTQQLIQANEANRVRDALAASVAENTLLRLRREERPYPLPYPYPYPHHEHHHGDSRRNSRG